MPGATSSTSAAAYPATATRATADDHRGEHDPSHPASLRARPAHAPHCAASLGHRRPKEKPAVEFDVTIEIPKGHRNKYEVDHETRPDPAGPDAVHLDGATRPTTATSRTRSARTATRSTRWSCSTSRPSPAAWCGAAPDRHVPHARRGRRRRQDPVHPGGRPAQEAHPRARGRQPVRPARDPALLRDLQGPRARQVGRGRPLGRPRGRRALHPGGHRARARRPA